MRAGVTAVGVSGSWLQGLRGELIIHVVSCVPDCLLYLCRSMPFMLAHSTTAIFESARLNLAMMAQRMAHGTVRPTDRASLELELGRERWSDGIGAPLPQPRPPPNISGSIIRFLGGWQQFEFGRTPTPFLRPISLPSLTKYRPANLDDFPAWVVFVVHSAE